MSLINRILCNVAFWKWVLLLTLAGAVLAPLSYYLIHGGVGLPLAAERVAMEIVHTFPDVGRQLAAKFCSTHALHIYRELFAILMFGFCVYESLHLAKIAWQGFKSEQHGKKAPIARVFRLVVLLILYAGPVGHHGLELFPPSLLSDTA